MQLIRYEGVILERDGALATSLSCCCDQCDCCRIEDADPLIFSSSFAHSGNFGVTGGVVISSELSTAPCSNRSIHSPNVTGGDGYERTCNGRIDFTARFTNGACQREEIVEGHACLYILESENNDDKGNCCYWEVFVEEPYDECLRDGFPDYETQQPAVLPGCNGADAPADCQFITPFDPCFGFCTENGWDEITIATNAPGTCNCDTYYLDTSPPGGGGSSPP